MRCISNKSLYEAKSILVIEFSENYFKRILKKSVISPLILIVIGKIFSL